MSTGVENKKCLAHITDAGDVVHMARITQTVSRETHKVVRLTIATGCEPRASGWFAKAVDSPFEYSKSLAHLPRFVHNGFLMAKYQPVSLIAPAVTCIDCLTMMSRNPWT